MPTESSPAIPIEAFSAPVLAYTVCDEAIRVRAVNEAFETSFGEIAPDASVSTIFAQFDLGTPDGKKELEAYMQCGESVEISLESVDQAATYCARVITTGNGRGYLIVASDSEKTLTEHADVGHVASVISHDLRNPLDVAKAHLEAARETGKPKHFETVSEAHDRMEQLIRNVLSLARGSDGLDSSEQISIAEVIDSAWHSVDTELATLEVSEPLPATTADPGRVQRLFENLFRNAIEHGSDGSHSPANDSGDRHSKSDGSASGSDGGQTLPNAPTKVTITVGPLEDGFYVADDGVGVPTGNRDEIFEPGYSTEHGGAGLGLAIVENIVTAHGWDLRLARSGEDGARFEIRFE